MYIYNALINALNTHMIHINLNMIFCMHVEHSPTKTMYMKYYTETHTHSQATTNSNVFDTDLYYTMWTVLVMTLLHCVKCGFKGSCRPVVQVWLYSLPVSIALPWPLVNLIKTVCYSCCEGLFVTHYHIASIPHHALHLQELSRSNTIKCIY